MNDGRTGDDDDSDARFRDMGNASLHANLMYH